MTLLAFAAEGRAAVDMDRKAAAPAAEHRAAVDRYRPPAWPTAANPPHVAAAVDIMLMRAQKCLIVSKLNRPLRYVKAIVFDEHIQCYK